MGDDFEDLYGLSDMDDDEIRELIRQQLQEHTRIDPDEIDVDVTDGRVRLSGRVGSEQDYQAIEHVLTDLIGLGAVSNEMMVDELRRGEQPEAADEANAARLEADGSHRGGANRTEDSAEHLLRDTASELHGTGNVSEAIERGYSYNPPTEPLQEGSESREDH
jgi:hypothetical protein